MGVPERSVGRATYLVSVPDGTLQRSYGKVFDQVAAEYDRYRPSYPEQLIDLACQVAGLEPGAADALVPDGTLALIQYFGLYEPRSAEDQQALLSAMSAIAPEIAESWPRYRELETMLAGVRERRENISEVWAWLGGYELAREYAAHLFDDAQIAAAPTLVEHTAAELGALLGTMSCWSRLSPEQREAIESANRDTARAARAADPL